jgi:hypothetical protein
MSNSVSKKARELFVLESFRELSPECPGGIVCTQEQPDFLFAPHSARVGLEVTELVRTPRAGARPLQEQEALRTRLGRKATEMYNALNLPPLHVGVHVQPNAALDKNDIPILAAKLVDLVAELNVDIDKMVRYPALDDYKSQPPSPVNFVNVGRIAGLTMSHWTVPTAAWVPTLEIGYVETVINRKSQSSRRNLPTDYTCWLLMVCGGSRLASSFIVPDQLYTHTFSSSFERVFLMDRTNGEVRELSTATSVFRELRKPIETNAAP